MLLAIKFNVKICIYFTELVQTKAECLYCVHSFAAASLLSSKLCKALRDTDPLFISSDTVKQLLNISISMPYDLILCKDFRYL